jgi:hypothetical protein
MQLMINQLFPDFIIFQMIPRRKIDGIFIFSTVVLLEGFISCEISLLFNRFYILESKTLQALLEIR